MFWHLLSSSLFIIKGSQDGKSNREKPGADSQAMKGCCLQAFSSWLVQPALLKNQDHEPRSVLTHGFVPSPSITN